jgi:WD40 repeat protein
LFSVDSEYSEVFATCSKHDIRVWNTETSLELLRITVPNFMCTGMQFSCDGKSIISGEFCAGCCMTYAIYCKAEFGLSFLWSKVVTSGVNNKLGTPYGPLKLLTSGLRNIKSSNFNILGTFFSPFYTMGKR